METKRFIKEKLNEEFNPNKRASMVKAIMNKCTNHLFDAYRELDLAIQYCDNPEMRQKLEMIRRSLGVDNEMSNHLDNETTTIFSAIQDLSKDIELGGA
jgi:hypothetical protein